MKVVSRYLGLQVDGVTIIPQNDVAGHLWCGPHDGATCRQQSIDRTRSICDEAQSLMPPAGEPRDGAEPWLTHVHARCVELMAGTAAEELFGADHPGTGSGSDIECAFRFAETLSYTVEAIE